MQQNNNNNNNRENSCLQIMCKGCYGFTKYCKFIYHCENECNALEIPCINYLAGCQVLKSKYLMSNHLEYDCEYKTPNHFCCFSKCPLVEGMKKMTIHPNCLDHCLNCIYRECTESDCPVIECDNKCGQWMHACKFNEHLDEICLNQKVPCICEKFGCTEKMPRYKLGRHLEFCQSSLIKCSFKWTRDVRNWKIYQTCLDSSVQSTQLRDRLKEALKSQINKIYRKKLGNALALQDEYEFARQFPLLLNDSELTTIEGELEELHSYMKQSKKGDLGGYLSLGFQYEDLLCILEECDVSGRHVCFPPPLWVNQNNGIIDFPCNCIVTRRQYSNHMATHAYLQMEVCSESSSALELRCPLVTHGCTYRITKLQVCDEVQPPLTLGYHPLFKSFTSTHQEQPHWETDKDRITNLPTEVIVRIMSHCDPFTLIQFALSHARLYNIWLEYHWSKKRPITLKWIRQPSNRCRRWKSIIEYVPFFSLVHSGIELINQNRVLYNLTFDKDAPKKLSNHMSSCRYWLNKTCTEEFKHPPLINTSYFERAFRRNYDADDDNDLFE